MSRTFISSRSMPSQLAAFLVVVILVNTSIGEIHTDFTAGMQRNGSASADTGSLRPSGFGNVGSAFWWQKQYVTDGFTTEFPFTIGRSGSGDGNFDTGFSFIIQNSSISALGTSSGTNNWDGLGYHGISDALVVEFDHRNNTPSPFSYNHIAVQSGGTGTVSCNHNSSLAFSSFVQSLQDAHTARITYSANRLKVWVDPSTYTTPWIDINVNIGSSLNLTDGTAWVGFTGASGNGWSTMQRWDFVEVPEPATLAIIALGGLFLRKRCKN